MSKFYGAILEPYADDEDYENFLYDLGYFEKYLGKDKENWLNYDSVALIKRGYKTIEAYKKIDLKEFNKLTNYKYDNNIDYKILLKNLKSRKIKDRNKLLASYSYIYQKESNNYGDNISERLSQLTNYSENYIKNLTKEAFTKNFISNNTKGISGGHLTNKCIKLLNSQ